MPYFRSDGSVLDSLSKPATKSAAKSATKSAEPKSAPKSETSARYDLFAVIPGDTSSYAYRVSVGKDDIGTKVGALFGPVEEHEDGSFTRPSDGARIYAGVVTG